MSPAAHAGSEAEPERITVESSARVTLVRSLSGPTDWARCIAWQPRTSRVYAGCKDGVIYVWDLETDDLPTRVRAAPC